jgi:GNAT superfamily N-acetyltransferase
MNIHFRNATKTDAAVIWEILQQAIRRRKEDGSNQWQDGYPNPDVIEQDIEKSAGFVLTADDNVIGYCAILINDEPEYAKIEGSWLTNGDFIVVHRVAISDSFLGKGLAKKIFLFIEEFAKKNRIPSIKVDTNFDNPAMMNVFEKSGYVYCGEVYFRGSPRKAYEKVIDI